MPERVRVHVSDGTREVTVEIRGGDDKALSQAERAATRLLKQVPQARPANTFGFNGWALSSDTERSPDTDD